MDEKVRAVCDTFHNLINPSLQYSQIIKPVTKLIRQGYEPDLLIFAIKYYAAKKPGRLNYPYGLFTVIKDKEMRELWFKPKAVEVKNKVNEVKPEPDEVLSWDEIPVYTQTSRLHSFADILR